MAKRWVITLMRLVGRNWITLFGASLTTVSALAILTFFTLGALGLADSPYIAVLALMVLPMVFMAGLLLIPAGAYWERKRLAEGADQRGRYPRIDFNKSAVRRSAAVVAALTFVNVVLIAVVSYEGVHYTESTEFCGTVCHTVMAPEHTAYLDSPHAQVECVECHIGPGAPWFVRSKLSGLGQVVAVTLGTYERPVPTPVHNLRPAQDTCMQCHWPSKFTGDRMKVIETFAEDEANTPLTTALLLHIGGGNRSQGGIHSWHIDPARQTTYISLDQRRETIPYVQVRDPDGQIVEYFAEDTDLTPDDLETAEKRTMDCIDCHNRPTHRHYLPHRAMDQALAEGRIDRSIPFVKKMGTQILKEVGDQFGDASQLPKLLAAYYKENHPDYYASNQRSVQAAGEELINLYNRNVFPAMRVTWGTYPNFIGHTDYDGCFRCHDGSHSTRDGEKSIGADCSTCHEVLAWEEEDPQIVKDLGITR
ncbi:MAG TPA: NapC/NirT family cytochrome c [Acidobacteriota bacterium]|nr:NapC/NirT family cytochrome c [Acidobacteriota bacterium]